MTVVQNPSNIFTNFNSNNTANGTRTNNWQNTTKPNNLQRTPKKDEFQKGNSDSNKKQKNILIGAGVALVAAAGLLFGHKLYKSNQIANALEKIEQKFVTLQDNMPEVQKTFKEVFLRGDISEKEAREMLDRYKEIEKLGVTGTKEEYARAIFDEAKRNYGFADSKLTISYEDLSSIGQAGNFAPGFNEVLISSGEPLERLMNIIHHEFRHAKQTYYAVNAEPDRYVQAINQGRKSKQRCSVEEILKPFNMTKPDKTLVPEEYKSFVEDVIQATTEQNYNGAEFVGEAYRNNGNEVDARFAGESIAKLFGLMAK